MITLEFEELSVSYNGTPALDGISHSIPGGAWIGLIGPNGAGKSTLLKTVAGLVPYSGRVRLGETDLAALAPRVVAQSVAFVPQRPLTPGAMSVTDYVLMGRTPYISYLGTEKPHDLAVVGEALERLDLSDLSSRRLGTLSGGELQRVVLARALAQQAPVLLLDEPIAALDVGHQQQVLELVDTLRADRDLTVVTAMHDLTLAGQFADELLLLNGGRIVAAGPAREVLTEAAIKENYGASVRIIENPDGSVVVIPTRGRVAHAVQAVYP